MVVPAARSSIFLFEYQSRQRKAARRPKARATVVNEFSLILSTGEKIHFGASHHRDPSDDEKIAAFIAKYGVTKCPPPVEADTEQERGVRLAGAPPVNVHRQGNRTQRQRSLHAIKGAQARWHKKQAKKVQS